MAGLRHTRALRGRIKWLPWLVIGLTLAILGGTILLARQQLRSVIREQIAGRGAELLHGVVLLQLREEASELEMPELINDPVFQFRAMLKTSRLEGVLAVRLFDPEGKFVEAFPMQAQEGSVEPADFAALRQLRPVSRFQPAVALSDVFWPEKTEGNVTSSLVPLLEVNVPLHVQGKNSLVGIAQFILLGKSIAAEFARLDRNLNLQALAAFGVGGGVLLVTMSWAFRRLRRAQELLGERTQNLLKANQELAFAVKTSAVGAVSAHLIHGLKNPLAGLQSFVTSLGPAQGELREAIATTRRMQAMINQVVSVLREDESAAQYEVTLPEVVDIVTARVAPLAHQSGVKFEVHCSGDGMLSSRAANLVTLVLVNLLQNAIEATPRGKGVAFKACKAGGEFVFQVKDDGPGLPEGCRRDLFAPCQSLKSEGSGIGLAISKHLADYLGAALELQSSTASGCVFALRIPVTVCAPGKPVEVSAGG